MANRYTRIFDAGGLRILRNLFILLAEASTLQDLSILHHMCLMEWVPSRASMEVISRANQVVRFGRLKTLT